MEGEGEFRGRMGVWRGKLTAVEGGAWVELGHQLRAAGTCPDPAWLDPGMSVSWVGSRMQLAGPRMGAPTRSLAMLTTLGMRPLAERGLRMCRRRGADWWCVHCLRHSLAPWHSSHSPFFVSVPALVPALAPALAAPALAPCFETASTCSSAAISSSRPPPPLPLLSVVAFPASAASHPFRPFSPLPGGLCRLPGICFGVKLGLALVGRLGGTAPWAGRTAAVD